MAGRAFHPGSSQSLIPDGPRDYFGYTVNLGSLAAAATANVNLAISADSDFWWTGLSYFSDLAGAAQTDSTRVIPLVTLQITDTGSGRQLFSAATPLASIAGDGSHLYRLIHPRFFARSTTIQCNGVNYSAATTYTNTYITFVGFKIFSNIPRLM